MFDDRELLEKRITRELWERVLPLVHPQRQELLIEAGPDLDHLEPFTVGSAWGPPWGTTWFRFSGDIPHSWTGERVEAVIDLGFNPDAAGFQCEGLVVDVVTDGSTTPLQGIHPRRTNYAIVPNAGPFRLHVEAASNPTFLQFTPSLLGRRTTAGEAPLYRFRTAALVIVDPEAEALVYDIEVLDGLMKSLSLDDPRRPRLLSSIVAALDCVPNLTKARGALSPALAESSNASMRHNMVAVGHAHIDTAWLWPIRETRRKCIRTFASAVALMDEYPEYKFVCSSAQHYAWIEEDEPVLFAKIVERVARGQWVPVGGMWVEADMNLPSGESLVRQFVFGQRYFESKFGMRCTEVWIPDVFGYPAGLPQIFAAAGMNRLVTQKLSWNKQNKFPHSTFWWEGLDGTRVLTHFPPVDTYNAEIAPAEVALAARNFRDHGWSTNSLMPFGYGDGGGGPTREMLERARRLADIDARSTIEIGTPDAMFARIEDEASSGAPVPVWRGELYFETHRGTLTSQLNTKLGNRRCERLLVEAELWSATLGRPAKIDDLWKQVLTQQFHDILPGSSIAWVHDDAEATFAAVEEELQQRISSLLSELSPSSTALVNPADTQLDAVIDLESHVCVEISAPQKTKSPTQTLGDGRIAFRASVPALGLGALRPLPVDDRVVVSDTSMANRHLAVRWDSAGNLTSVIDIANAREIVPEGKLFATLELARDHPVEYDAWDIESWTRRSGRALTTAMPRGDTVEVAVEDEGPLIARVRVKRTFGPSSCVVTYELRAESRQLLVHLDLDWHHDEHLLSMAFPLDVQTATALCDVQLGVVERPTHPSSPWDAAKFEVCAHRYVDFSEPGFGVAVLNTGRYGHSLFDGAVRVSLARATKYPDPDADHGHHEVTFAILPHGPGLAEVRAAASLLNAPVRAVQGSAENDPSEHPLENPLVAVTGQNHNHDPGVEIDAVKLADDESGDLIVRLHEACGNRVRVSIRGRDPVTAASRCNLLEEWESDEEVGDGIVTMTLRPFQLVTLRLHQ